MSTERRSLNMASTTYRHMMLEDRKIIENLLNTSCITLKQISMTLGRDPKTIREEIKGHRYLFIAAQRRNKCGMQESCEQVRLCNHCEHGKCKFCKHRNCNEICGNFCAEPDCALTEKFPFVCSGCGNLSSCKLPKYFYKAEKAQAERDANVSQWKCGPQKSPEDMKKIIEVFEEGIPNGNAPDILIHTNELNISTSTAYRYIHQRNMGNVKAIDLKRAVRYKPQERSRVSPTPIDYDFLEGRRYSDFCDLLMNLPPSVHIWEMDTVQGKKGTKKCALSLLHRKSNLQLYFLLDDKTALEVKRVFDGIKGFLGPKLFADVFTVILTDNGGEFHDPISLETDPETGEKLISIYYCRPRRSDDKAKCEKNHEHFREIVPKGASMENLSRKDMRYVSNNVNNYPRKELDYKSPYELASVLLPKKVLALNSLNYLPHNQVKLIPIIH